MAAIDFPVPTQVGEPFIDPSGVTYVCRVVGPPAVWAQDLSGVIPSNYVTLDTTQDITGAKTFALEIEAFGGVAASDWVYAKKTNQSFAAIAPLATGGGVIGGPELDFYSSALDGTNRVFVGKMGPTGLLVGGTDTPLGEKARIELDGDARFCDGKIRMSSGTLEIRPATFSDDFSLSIHDFGQTDEEVFRVNQAGGTTLIGNSDGTGDLTTTNAKIALNADGSASFTNTVTVTGDVRASGTTGALFAVDNTSAAETVTTGSWFADGSISVNKVTATGSADSTFVGNIVTEGSVTTGDLVMNNTRHENGNEIDGTQGHWCFQEGKSGIYVINRLTGQRYTMNLTPVDE